LSSRLAACALVGLAASIPAVALADQPGSPAAASAQPAGGAARPGQAKPDQPADQATAPAPPAAEPEPPADGASAGADELTDADFGVVGPDVKVTAAERRDLSWLDLAVGAGLSTRKLDFESAPGMGGLTPPPFRSGTSWRLSSALTVHPFAWKGRSGALGDLGLLAEYGRTIARADQGDELSRESQLYVGLGYRIPVGTSETQPSFRLSAGYLRQEVRILDDSVDFPDVEYQALAIGADVRAPIGTPRAALCARARYIVVGTAGDLLAADTYGDARVAGLELGGFLEVRPLALVFLRVEGNYTRYSMEFNGTGMLNNPAVSGATDRYITGTLSTGLFL